MRLLPTSAEFARDVHSLLVHSKPVLRGKRSLQQLHSHSLVCRHCPSPHPLRLENVLDRASFLRLVDEHRLYHSHECFQLSRGERCPTVSSTRLLDRILILIFHRKDDPIVPGLAVLNELFQSPIPLRPPSGWQFPEGFDMHSGDAVRSWEKAVKYSFLADYSPRCTAKGPYVTGEGARLVRLEPVFRRPRMERRARLQSLLLGGEKCLAKVSK